jgi:hypothetical protein
VDDLLVPDVPVSFDCVVIWYLILVLIR